MSLTSSSTTAQIEAAYVDNADYAEADSTTKAAAFIQACRILLIKRPRRASHGSESLEIDHSVIRAQLDEAVQWWRSHADSEPTGDAGPGYVSLENSRL